MIDADDPRLTAYILGELDAEERRVVEVALQAAPELAAEVEALRSASDWVACGLTGAGAPALTAGQRARLNALGEDPPVMPPPMGARAWGWAALRGCALAAVLLTPLWLVLPPLTRFESASVPPVPRVREPAAPSVQPRASESPRPSESLRPSPNPVQSVAAAPSLQSLPGNPYVNVPAGQQLAAAPRVYDREPGTALPGDLRRNAVDLKTPYRGLQNAGSTIQNWVRGGSGNLGNRMHSNYDYAYDYTRGSPAGYSPYAYAPGTSYAAPSNTGSATTGTTVGMGDIGWGGAAEISRQLAEAGAGYAAAERSGDQATAAQWLLRRNALDKRLRATKSGEVVPTASPDVLVENDFQPAKGQPLATFAIDVDTASYSKVRRYLESGQKPHVDEVRIEEMVNYFPYDYPEPDAGEPLTVSAEVAECPWAPKHRLVRIALKGRTVPAKQRPRSNLVFLIDVSGSMGSEDRLPLVQRSLKLLVEQLGEEDQVALVVYAGASGLVLPSTPASQKTRILDAIQRLSAGGSTNGGEGVELAYRTAKAGFITGGNNRVILTTDGDFNVGVTSRGDLERLIQSKAKSGVFLSVLGFGMGNHQDSTLERLADRGNGNHAYIDSLREARKVLVEQAGGTLITVAKDVKVQVEFNPATVSAWRQIGYENRVLAARDFNDDTKDAGELGSGHTVTALFEIEPASKGAALADPAIDPLRYQLTSLAQGPVAAELLAVKVRFQKPEGSPSRLLSFPLTDRGPEFRYASDDFRWAAAVASFGMVLRGSRHRGTATLGSVRAIAEGARGPDRAGHRGELVSLLARAESVLR